MRKAIGSTPALVANYGQFIQAIFDFIIVTFAIFMAIKPMNKLRRQKTAETPPAPSAEAVLLTEIRELLKAQLKDKYT